MTENELFEQPVLEAIISAIESYEKNDLDGWELYLVKRRAELAEKENAELQAQINELREALEFWSGIIDYQYTGNSEAMSFIQNADDLTQQALAKTAPQCLQEHDNEVIEMCAKVCESLKEQDYCVDVRTGAEAIRALKGKL